MYLIDQIKNIKTINPMQRIIIDWEDAPYVISGNGAAQEAGYNGIGSPAVPGVEFKVKCGLGECDVRWVRYLSWGNLILEAIDGDYVFVSMAQIERLGNAAPRIFVRRLFIDPGNAVVSAVSGKDAVTKKKGVKRALESAEEVPENTTKNGKRYEYADCNRICNGIRRTFGKVTDDRLKPWTIRLLVHIVSLTGCDFTRGLPYFTGNAAFTNKELLWPGLCAAASVDDSTGIVSLCPRIMAERFVGKLYKEVQFPKQCSAGSMMNADFETLSRFLSTCETIGKSRRERIISPGDLGCLIKSGNWVTFYWSLPEQCPCSVFSVGEYGFKEEKPGGKVIFDDKKPLPAMKKGRTSAQTMQSHIAWPP